MSSLWTPEGEHRVDRADGASAEVDPAEPYQGPDGDMELTAEDERELAARLDELRHQLLSTPAEVVIANHAYGLFELAAIHLSQQPPALDQARLAVDAMGALVDGLTGRMGDAEPSLKDALAQIRLAFVQLGGGSAAPGSEGVPG